MFGMLSFEHTPPPAIHTPTGSRSNLTSIGGLFRSDVLKATYWVDKPPAQPQVWDSRAPSVSNEIAGPSAEDAFLQGDDCIANGLTE